MIKIVFGMSMHTKKKVTTIITEDGRHITPNRDLLRHNEMVQNDVAIHPQ